MEYYTKFPRMTDARVLILEPMLATGGSLAWACDQVKAKGATDITAVCVVSAPAGIAVMNQRHPDVRIVTASIDRGLESELLYPAGPGRHGRPAVWNGMTPFEESVLEVLRSLRPGEVVTYGEVAEMAGYPGRARGSGSNPEIDRRGSAVVESGRPRRAADLTQPRRTGRPAAT